MLKGRYIGWLEGQGVRLFEGGGAYWRLYQGALVPAPATPCFLELSREEARDLLKESKAWFIRYASRPSEKPTEWWYVVCDSYVPDRLSANVRNQLRRGKRNSSVRRIDAEWLAKYGYECYCAAYKRYRNATPDNAKKFRNDTLRTVGGPFDYWGVFVDGRLAGYCQCIIEDNQVATNIVKYDPEFLKRFTSYALIDTVVGYYVMKRGMSISNGARSISHDTNMQKFLLRFGFVRQFCRLNVIYQPWLELAIQTLFPLRKSIAKLPDFGPAHKLQALLYQEELQRGSNAG